MHLQILSQLTKSGGMQDDKPNFYVLPCHPGLHEPNPHNIFGLSEFSPTLVT